MVGGWYEALKQGIMPAGNGACDVRAAANALRTLFTTVVCVCTQIICSWKCPCECVFIQSHSEREKSGKCVEKRDCLCNKITKLSRKLQRLSDPRL